ncbi:hypothetical protein [Sediminibacillus albus]|uniref:Uncharacterized protein n=1 Tax=Sediminibacillus albus TaxID=407036 RepID=A0A1G8X5Z6_9BACI|nr:hypothetical protein [Sediminibacillus albus]SDJ85983.1 hypothetical protein SAMN05216243_1180 [Sediminibacillus albus]
MKKILTLVGVLVLAVAGFATNASASDEETKVTVQSVDDINFDNAYEIDAGETITSTIINRYADPKVYKVMFPYSTEAGFSIFSLDAYYNMEIYDENYTQIAFLEDDDRIMQVDGNSWYYLVVRAGTTSSYGYDFQLRTVY